MKIKEILEDKNYLKYTKKNLDGIKEFCERFKQDWVFVTSGYEGSGKSTLTLQEATYLNEKFYPSRNGAWNIKDFILLNKKFRKQRGEVIFLDESARMFLGKESAQKANILLVKIFISNRSFGLFHFLNIPNPFYLERYLREFRIRTLNYTFFDYTNPERRLFAFYTKKDYTKILLDKRARYYIIDSERFTKAFKPSFFEEFKQIDEDEKFWQDYMKCKERFQVDMLDEALAEAIKLEENRKLGFHEGMNPEEFLKFLASEYRLWRSALLKFNTEEVARRWMIKTEVFEDLLHVLRSEGYLERLSKTRYRLTEKGLRVIEAEKIYGNKELTKRLLVTGS